MNIKKNFNKTGKAFVAVIFILIIVAAIVNNYNNSRPGAECAVCITKKTTRCGINFVDPYNSRTEISIRLVNLTYTDDGKWDSKCGALEYMCNLWGSNNQTLTSGYDCAWNNETADCTCRVKPAPKTEKIEI